MLNRDCASLTIVIKSWHGAQKSALGDVVVMLQFFVSCFRTARMFLFAYILVVVSPGELNVAFLYLFWEIPLVLLPNVTFY